MSRVPSATLTLKPFNGKTSSPCLIVDSNSSCDTDESRPLFVQKGSTLFGIRDFLPPPTSTSPEYQYVGYAAKFGVLDVHSRLDIATYDPIHVAFDVDYLNNLLFDHNNINNKTPVTNLENSQYMPPATPSISALNSTSTTTRPAAVTALTSSPARATKER